MCLVSLFHRGDVSGVFVSKGRYVLGGCKGAICLILFCNRGDQSGVPRRRDLYE